jgi:cardiolipin synthase (CMP-forming)
VPAARTPIQPQRRRRGVRRLVGLDRSGPEPAATRKGQPLRPLTIPNLVGYVRLAAIPVFLYLALDSSDGRTAASALVYLGITAGDYVDGLLARATGQYSRLGALMDPVVDRLAVLAGAAVCWKFELLPRWALALLAARELVTVAIAQLGLRRGVDIEINWVGRIGVLMVMGGLFWTLVVDHWAPAVLFFTGLVFSIGATTLYVKAGLTTRRS